MHPLNLIRKLIEPEECRRQFSALGLERAPRFAGAGAGAGFASPSPWTPAALWSGSASIDSRTGFESALPEFSGIALPEQSDAVSTSIDLTGSDPATPSGTYTDGTYLQCAVSGTYDAGTGALALTGSCDDFAVTIAATKTGSDFIGTVTVGRGGGASETRNVTLARGAAVSLAAAYYVDQVAGNDANDGLTPGAPKKTIAALPALANGNIIRLARGSRWREQVGSGYNGTNVLHVQAYGVGPRPILDATDVVTVWAKTAGRTNVYECLVTPQYNDITASYLVLENGISLVAVADQAACDATAGTFVKRQLSTTPGAQTLYIHALGSGDPATNGKTYEVTLRQAAVVARGSSTVRGIHGRGCLTDSGTIALYQSNTLAGGETPLIDDCVAEWGHSHNIYTHDGSITRSVTVGSELGGHATNASIVFNRAVCSGENITLDDCAILDFPSHAAREPVGSAAFICHHNTSGNWGTLEISRVGAAYQTGCSSSHATTVAYSDCLFERKRNPSNGVAFVSVDSVDTTHVTLDRCRLYNHVIGDVSGLIASGIANPPDVRVTDCILTQRGGSSGMCRSTGTWAFERCHFDALNVTDWTMMFYSSGAASVSANNCTVHSSIYGFMLGASSALVASDYNALWSTADVQETPTATRRDVSVYLGDQTALDQHSTMTLPTYETGTDTGARPTFIETAASRAARGFACGPAPSAPGGAGWAVPPVYAAWLPIVEAL